MNQEIKTAFFVYPSAFQNIGGGEILLLKTKEYLEKEGVSVKLFDIWNDKLDEFNILHIFGAVRPCLGLMNTAKNKGIKVVLTPVTYYDFDMAMHEYGSMQKKINNSIRYAVKRVFPIYPSDRRKMLVLADALIPNSEAEKSQLAQLFAIAKEKMHVIPNCVDKEFANANPDLFLSKYNISDFVLSVGRIEPRKNQLNLIKALSGFNKPLVFIGDPVSDYSEYYNECKKHSNKNITFIGKINHKDELLKSAYAACKCFVSQGWLETPGLACLEAGLAGANIATTNKGCTKEYFKDYVEYFNPAKLSSIRKAAEAAFFKNKNSLFKDYIMKNLLWDVAAKKNLEIYENLVNS